MSRERSRQCSVTCLSVLVACLDSLIGGLWYGLRRRLAGRSLVSKVRYCIIPIVIVFSSALPAAKEMVLGRPNVACLQTGPPPEVVLLRFLEEEGLDPVERVRLGVALLLVCIDERLKLFN